MIDVPGTLYVAHLEPAYRHARHYTGWTADPAGRWGTHTAGHGSPLIRAAVAAGSRITFAIIGSGTRADEKRLKARKNGSRYCPTCVASRQHDTPQQGVNA